MSEALCAVELADSILYQTVGKEVILLNLVNQEYYSLDSVGADVWELLMKMPDVDAVARKLATIYEVDEETAKNDVRALVSDFIAMKLLKSANS